MMVTSTGLLVLSAVLHALWNAVVKKSTDGQTTLLGILIVAALVAALCCVGLARPIFNGAGALYWSVGAGFFEAAYMIFLAKALRDASLGVSYVIMRGGAMLIVWFLSSLFLGEVLTAKAGLGVFTVLVGLIVTQSQSKTRNIEPGGAVQGVPGRSAGRLRWPLLCAVFIAGYHLCYGRAMLAAAKATAVFAVAMAVAVPVFAATVGRSGLRSLSVRFRAGALPLILGGMVCAFSFILFLLGLRTAGAGYAITLRNTSILFAQVFALVIGERVTAKQWAGAGLVMVGASCLAI